MGVNMKNLVTRSLSGLVLAVVFFSAIYFSKWGFGALMVAIVVGCQREFYRMCRAAGSEPQQFAGSALGVALAVMAFVIFMQFGGSGTVEAVVGKTVYALGLYMLLLEREVVFTEDVERIFGKRKKDILREQREAEQKAKAEAERAAAAESATLAEEVLAENPEEPTAENA